MDHMIWCPEFGPKTWESPVLYPDRLLQAKEGRRFD